MPRTFEGKLVSPKGRFAITVSRFNSFITEPLLAGAVDALVRHGVADADIDVFKCPGTWELPGLTRRLAESGTYLIDDLFDTGSAAVEAAVLADVTLGGQCQDLHLTSVEYTIEPDEDRRFGSARHTFNCIYFSTD